MKNLVVIILICFLFSIIGCSSYKSTSTKSKKNTTIVVPPNVPSNKYSEKRQRH